MQLETKRRTELQIKGWEYTRRGIDAKKAAAIGTKVKFRDDDGMNFGEIIGIYPHVCAVKVKSGAGYRTKCRQWHEMGRPL